MDTAQQKSEERRKARRNALAELALTSAVANADDGVDHVRRLARLLKDGSHGRSLLPQLEKWLEAGADAAAALRLVEDCAGYMLSRGAGGRHLATVVLAGQCEEFHAEGASAALALVGALAGALGSTLRAPGADCGTVSADRVDLRLN